MSLFGNEGRLHGIATHGGEQKGGLPPGGLQSNFFMPVPPLPTPSHQDKLMLLEWIARENQRIAMTMIVSQMHAARVLWPGFPFFAFPPVASISDVLSRDEMPDAAERPDPVPRPPGVYFCKL